jgi:hypothetical protein
VDLGVSPPSSLWVGGNVGSLSFFSFTSVLASASFSEYQNTLKDLNLYFFPKSNG